VTPEQRKLVTNTLHRVYVGALVLFVGLVFFLWVVGLIAGRLPNPIELLVLIWPLIPIALVARFAMEYVRLGGGKE
jgi:hypothetical protein